MAEQQFKKEVMGTFEPSKPVQIKPSTLVNYWNAECEFEIEHNPWRKTTNAVGIVVMQIFPNHNIRNIRPILKDPEKMSFNEEDKLGDKDSEPNSEMDKVWNAQTMVKWIDDARKAGYDMGGEDTDGNYYPSLIKAGLAIERSEK